MTKYDLIPKKLLADGIIDKDDLFAPQLLDPSEILSVHSAEYWHKLSTGTLSAKECRKIGLPMSPSLVERERFISHATYECALHALADGVSLSTSGGTHHAFAGHGEGFCVFNDVALASRLLLDRGQVRRILSVDLDVHQGNGNASIMGAWDEVFVFSMHGAKNYPFIKTASDLDIELPNDTDDGAYLSILERHLPELIAGHDPELLFYQAGVDVLVSDRFGKLSLSLDGLYARDRLVFETAYRFGVPVCTVMGGGYSQVETVVAGHCGTFLAALQVWC